MELSGNTVLRRSENVVFRKIEDECILVPVAPSVADVKSIFNLNNTAAFLWDKIDGKKRLKDIIAEIRREYDADDHQLEGDVISFVAEMVEAKLIET